MSDLSHIAKNPRTWHGDRGEQWSPAQGLESVLLSIQSLLSPNPYTLEPGFENPERSNDTENMETYKSKVFPRDISEPLIEQTAHIATPDSTREPPASSDRTA